MRAQFFRLAHITHTMVHPFLGQVLIMQEWEVSLPDVGSNKTLRIGLRPMPLILKRTIPYWGKIRSSHKNFS